ncbi:MAG: hypothetical protein JXA10_19455 [Anaerolineae bacterium]|nr:hypothetical protein [Anaerolineae bacterium]
MYWSTPQATYDERRRAYLEYCSANPGGWRTGFFSQIARLELGQEAAQEAVDEAVDEESIREGIAFIDSRQDCCDFAVGGMLRILYQYRDSSLISRELIRDIETCLLNFKYWWDEPQGDNKRCYHTENHQIIFHSDELLAGQLFRDQTFTNSGETGAYHIEHALHLIRRWFEFRIQFGFSEWLSNCYFEEDLLALVNLYDFAEQLDIRATAKLLIDMIMFEMALHTYRGVMGGTHGRTYTRLIKGARGDHATNTAKLMFGMGLYNSPSILGTVSLATSSYRCPPVIAAIAADLDGSRVFKERHSFNIEDAPKFGLSFDDMEDGYLYWSVQNYTHPAIVNLAIRTKERFEIMLFEDYQTRYDQLFRWQLNEYGEIVQPNVECHAMTEVHVQTYRGPHGMISTAQDYRPGTAGYQQHIWQATLGIDAVVFTNHPGAEDNISRPNFWAGNGILPRAVQQENCVICLHHVPADDAFPYSHAYFSRAAFDEIVERGNWIFARQGEGYLALYSSQPPQWITNDEGVIEELRAESPDNVWICEIGDAAQSGSFEDFVRAITAAKVTIDGLEVMYESPSAGALAFGWHEAFTVNGVAVDVHSYERFDNPYCQAKFGARQITITHEGESVTLDFDAAAQAI